MSATEAKVNREDVQELLDTAAEYQTLFWSALGELERALGDDVDIPAENDLEGWDADSLIEEYCKEEEVAS